MKFIGIPKDYKRPGEGFRTVLGMALLLALAFVSILGADAMFSNPKSGNESQMTAETFPVEQTEFPGDITDPSLSPTINPGVSSPTDPNVTSTVTPSVPPSTAPSATNPTSPPVTETKESATYYATAEINIRSGPGTDYEIVDTLERGDKLQVTASTDNGWKKVGDSRYVISTYVSKTPPSQPASGTYYTTGVVNVRSGPGTEYSIVKELSEGSAIEVTALTANGWYKTVKDTYVLASLCSKTKPLTPTPTPKPTPKPTAKPTPTPKPIPDGVAEKAAAVGLSVDDFELMAGIVESERPSGSGNYPGQVWVAQVIWNRVNSNKWPNTVYKVITQSGQFSTWLGGYETSRNPTDSSREAVVQAFQDPPIPAGVLFFDSRYLSDPPPEGYYDTCGGNHFYYYK